MGNVLAFPDGYNDSSQKVWFLNQIFSFQKLYSFFSPKIYHIHVLNEDIFPLLTISQKNTDENQISLKKFDLIYNIQYNHKYIQNAFFKKSYNNL